MKERPMVELFTFPVWKNTKPRTISRLGAFLVARDERTTRKGEFELP